MTDFLRTCAISGKRLDSDDPIIQTERGAFGVKANLLNTLTEELRAEIEARLFSEGAVEEPNADDAGIRRRSRRSTGSVESNLSDDNT